MVPQWLQAQPERPAYPLRVLEVRHRRRHRRRFPTVARRCLPTDPHRLPLLRRRRARHNLQPAPLLRRWGLRLPHSTLLRRQRQRRRRLPRHSPLRRPRLSCRPRQGVASQVRGRRDPLGRQAVLQPLPVLPELRSNPITLRIHSSSLQVCNRSNRSKARHTYTYIF